MEKVGVDAVPGHAVCVLHKGAWLKWHMEGYVFLAGPAFTICRATWGFAKRHGLFPNSQSQKSSHLGSIQSCGCLGLSRDVDITIHKLWASGTF